MTPKEAALTAYVLAWDQVTAYSLSAEQHERLSQAVELQARHLFAQYRQGKGLSA